MSTARSGPTDLAINGRFLSQPTTGVQRVACELVREIDKLVAAEMYPFAPRLFCQRGAPADSLGLKATRIEELGGPGGHFWEQVTLPLAIGGAHLLCLGNTAPLTLLWRKRPVTLMIHDLSYRIYPQAYRRSYRLLHGLMTRTLLTRAATIFTVSKPERLMLESLVPDCRGHVHVAQNGGWRDLDDSARVTSAPVAGRYVLYVGSLSRRKNIEGILRLAVRLWREEGVRTVLAGSAGTMLRPVTLNIPEDAQAAIVFTGQIEDLDVLASLYRHADCLIFPSFYEASPLPPLEAMHFGCPVVVSDIASLRERCGEAAEYCDPANVDDMLAAVRRAIGSPGRAAELRALGYDRQKAYSWRQQARTILATITASMESQSD